MSNRKFSPTFWDDLHFSRTEEYAHRIEMIYQSALREATRQVHSVRVDPAKPFQFVDYPVTAQKVGEILQKLTSQLLVTIRAGHQAEWDLANQKNDALVSSVIKSTGLSKGTVSQYMSRNLEALTAFQNRVSQGLNLSQRVTRYTAQFRNELELGLSVGLGEGRSADSLSRDLRANLKDPDRLFRRVRNKHGQLVLSRNAAALHPGQGVYRSSYKNMMRLTRTEINMAYREADHARWQELDFVVGIEVRRSNNPYACDICEPLKGKYPKDFKFVGWHPQCRCHAVSILASPEELRQLNRMILKGEDTRSFRSAGEITELPENFIRWAQANDQRLARRPPQFISDNIKQGKFSLSVPPQIDLGSFIQGDIPTNKEMKAVIMEFARLNPEHFSSGLESVSILKSTSYLMQHSRMYSPGTNKWIGQSTLSLSTHTVKMSGVEFNPVEELRGALAAMKAGTPLSFNQEYSMEALWHEILHAKSQTPPRKLGVNGVRAMETLNQFSARHTYDTLLKAFGVKPVHQAAVLDNGYGYKQWVASFRSSLKFRGIDEKTALTDLFPVLMNDYAKIDATMTAYLKKK